MQELATDASLIVTAPTGSETTASNPRLQMLLLLWAHLQGRWMMFGSSTGLRLPDTSVLCPYAFLVRLGR